MRPWMVILTGVVLLGISSAALASVDFEAGMWYRVQHPGGYGSEGPFKMEYYGTTKTATTRDASKDFWTYCVERAEFFSPGSYYQFAVNDAQNLSSNTGRRLTGYSAWVYNKFRAGEIPIGTLTGHTATGDYNTVQLAIWAGVIGQNADVSLQANIGKIVLADWNSYSSGITATVVRSNNKPFQGAEWGYSPANTAAMWNQFDALGLGWDDFQNSTWFGSYGYVSTGGTPVVLLFNNGVQDFLGTIGNVVIEENGVPEPASLIVWSLLGCLGVSLAWRRRRKAG